MDPVSVLRTIWHHKLVAFLVVVVTVGAGAYVYLQSPRNFESTMVYAVIAPDLPTESEIEKNPELELLNSDNPFLRSPDSSLVVQVMLAKLNSDAVADAMEASNLASTFEVSAGGNSGSAPLIRILAEGTSPAQSIGTTRALGDRLSEELYEIQKVDGADDTFLYTVLEVQPVDRATERFSDRLRLIIVLFVGGCALLFAAVSLARSAEQARARRRVARGRAKSTRPSSRGRTASAAKTSAEADEVAASGPDLTSPTRVADREPEPADRGAG